MGCGEKNFPGLGQGLLAVCPLVYPPTYPGVCPRPCPHFIPDSGLSARYQHCVHSMDKLLGLYRGYPQSKSQRTDVV